MSLYTSIKIAIADDHELILDGLNQMIRNAPDFTIVGEAHDGAALLQVVRQWSPDVVLTDIRMPVMDGVEVTRKISEEFPNIGVIALSSYDEDELIIDMLQAGAKGFILKTSHKTEIIRAIHAVHKGESFYCRHTNTRLSEMIARKKLNPLRSNAKPLFTERELQIIRQICEGSSSKIIAAHLGLRTRTIERYRDTIMDKMDVKNAPALVAYAIEHKLYKPK